MTSSAELDGDGGVIGSSSNSEARGSGPGVARGVSVITRSAAFVRENSAPVCLGLVLVAIAGYTAVFSALAIRNYENFGNWSYDFAIYDQALWMVSRGGGTFMTIRGLDVWGHHVTLIAYVFAPFSHWFDGPEPILVGQSLGLGLGALPVYLIARRRFARPWVGLLFAGAYLLYAPLQNINSRDFHPESLVVAPFLFAWYCALTRRWGWMFVCVTIGMSAREDAALAVIMLGVSLVIVNWRAGDRRTVTRVAGLVTLWGLVWYAVCTQLVIPHFNDGDSAFYLEFFYSRWGGSFSGIVENMIRHPDRVVNDFVQHDRITFYKQLMWPLAWLPILSPACLLMGFPQLLASVIGDSPYARSIQYQYTAVLIAPIMIAAIEASSRWARIAARHWRDTPFVRSVAGADAWPLVRVGVPLALVVTTAITNVAWSPSPVGNNHGVFVQHNPRRDALERAVALVPDDAVVTSSYNLGPHLSRRQGSYNWPNPFWPEYWGRGTAAANDCTGFPSTSQIDYIAVDLTSIGIAGNEPFIEALYGPDGDFEVVDQDLLADHNVLVARRIEPGPGPDHTPLPPNCSDAPLPLPAGSPGTREWIIGVYLPDLAVPTGRETGTAAGTG